MCTYAMMRQPEPTRVVPPPPAVPREMVTYSRIWLSSPSVRPVGSPAYFRSCGGTPSAQNGANRLPLPARKRPSSTTCDTSSQPSPSSTSGPTVQNGPTVQDGGTRAPSATRAVGWMLTR